MKKIIVLAAVLAIALPSCAAAASVVLPEPQREGGPGIFSTLSSRVSAPERNFTKDDLTLDELSALLWATTGRNGENSWTVPVITGRDPNVSVFVMLRKGGFLYNWEKNGLIEVNEKKILRSAVSQDFAKSAPCLLVFVDRGVININGIAELAAGAMSQNAALAANALRLKARLLTAFNRTFIEDALNLGPMHSIIAVLAVGRQ